MGMIDIQVNEVTTTTRYRIADLDHPMYHPDTFDTFEEAQEVLDKEYTNRDKGDGFDENWRNRRTGVQKVTRTVETLSDNKA